MNITYVIGIDVGGTFTDGVAARPDGTLLSAKTPSTPPDYARGVREVIDLIAAKAEVETGSLLGGTGHIAHGTTSTLNALVTGNVAKVGFLTTIGHRDSIYIMNVSGRYAGRAPHEIQDIANTAKPPPLLPKRQVKEVVERVDYKGAVIVPLDEEAARSVITELLGDGVEAIAISTLWSFINPVHEQRLRELVHEQNPDVFVALSSELSPRIREYARNTTTIMNTQVGPTLGGYLGPLTQSLADDGLAGPLLVMQGSGGTISSEEAPRSAITTVGSVLTGGVVGAVKLGELLGHENIISTDVGGTTFLVGLVVDGQPVRTNSTIINQHEIYSPMIKVDMIGSGGGAIAGIDAGGNLRVGPNSAQAVPGPACYDAGGIEPTVTDADLVLGIISPDYFLGGQKQLSRERAAEAIRGRIAEPLGLSVEQAAAAIFTVQNAQTADLARKVVVEAGHDPRDFVMYSFGGAGPVHCCGYGAELGVKEIVIPLGPAAAAFSAYGLAASNVSVVREVSDPANVPVPGEHVTEVFERLEEQARDDLGRQGLEFAEVIFEREADIRYTQQLAEVATPVPAGPISDEGVATIVAEFEQLYARTFGEETGFAGAGFQFITYRVQGTGVLPFAPSLPRVGEADGSSPKVALKETRPVLMDIDRGFEETPIFDYGKLAAGHLIEGPAVIEVPTTTVAIPAGSVANIDHLGNVRLPQGKGGESA